MKIGFESHKNDVKNPSVYHNCTNHPTLCRITIWASIITKSLSIQGSSLNLMVNTTLLPDGSTHRSSNQFIIAKLRLATAILGHDEHLIYPIRIWTPFTQKWSNNGNVFSGNPCNNHQLNWKMEKQSIHGLHLSSSRKIFLPRE
jgi:hypothetical protein